MLCPKCNKENPYGSSFCESCGSPLAGSEPYTENVSNFNSYNTAQQTAYNNSSYFPQNNMPYQQNMVNYPPNNYNPYEEHVSAMEWIGIICLNIIPVIGSLVYIVLLFVWAFGNTRKRSLKTFAQAQLIIIGIAVVLLILSMAIAGISFDELASELT